MTNSTPQSKYQEKLAAGEFLEDPAQAHVVALLEDLYQLLACVCTNGIKENLAQDHLPLGCAQLEKDHEGNHWKTYLISGHHRNP